VCATCVSVAPSPHTPWKKLISERHRKRSILQTSGKMETSVCWSQIADQIEIEEQLLRSGVGSCNISGAVVRSLLRSRPPKRLERVYRSQPTISMHSRLPQKSDIAQPGNEDRAFSAPLLLGGSCAPRQGYYRGVRLGSLQRVRSAASGAVRGLRQREWHQASVLCRFRGGEKRFGQYFGRLMCSDRTEGCPIRMAVAYCIVSP
jgi:hypothetical protein